MKNLKNKFSKVGKLLQPDSKNDVAEHEVKSPPKRTVDIKESKKKLGDYKKQSHQLVNTNTKATQKFKSIVRSNEDTIVKIQKLIALNDSLSQQNESLDDSIRNLNYDLQREKKKLTDIKLHNNDLEVNQKHLNEDVENLTSQKKEIELQIASRRTENYHLLKELSKKRPLLKRIKSQLSDQENELKLSLSELEETESELKKVKSEYDVCLKKHEHHIQKTESVKRLIQKLNNEHLDYKNQIFQLKEKSTTYEDEISALNEKLTFLKKSNNEIRDDLSRTRKQSQLLTSKKNDIQREVDLLEKNKNELNSQLDSLRNEKSQTQSQIREASSNKESKKRELYQVQSQKDAIERKIAWHKAEIENIDTHLNEIYVLKGNLTSHIKELEPQLESKKEQYLNLFHTRKREQESVNNLKSSKNQIENKLKEWDNKLKHQKNKISNHRETMSSIESKITQSKSKISELKSSALKADQEIDLKSQSIKKLNQELNLINKEVDNWATKLNYKQNQLSEVASKFQETEKELHTSKQKVVSTKDKVDKLQSEINDLKKQDDFYKKSIENNNKSKLEYTKKQQLLTGQITSLEQKVLPLKDNHNRYQQLLKQEAELYTALKQKSKKLKNEVEELEFAINGAKKDTKVHHDKSLELSSLCSELEGKKQSHQKLFSKVIGNHNNILVELDFYKNEQQELENKISSTINTINTKENSIVKLEKSLKEEHEKKSKLEAVHKDKVKCSHELDQKIEALTQKIERQAYENLIIKQRVENNYKFSTSKEDKIADLKSKINNSSQKHSVYNLFNNISNQIHNELNDNDFENLSLLKNITENQSQYECSIEVGPIQFLKEDLEPITKKIKRTCMDKYKNHNLNITNKFSLSNGKTVNKILFIIQVSKSSTKEVYGNQEQRV